MMSLFDRSKGAYLSSYKRRNYTCNLEFSLFKTSTEFVPAVTAFAGCTNVRFRTQIVELCGFNTDGAGKINQVLTGNEMDTEEFLASLDVTVTGDLC